MRLHFLQKANKDSAPLRDGTVDLETGVVEQTTAQELRVQALFRDRLIGVLRAGHSLSKGRITPSRYAGGQHVSVSRQGLEQGPMEEALLPRKRLCCREPVMCVALHVWIGFLPTREHVKSGSENVREWLIGSLVDWWILK